MEVVLAATYHDPTGRLCAQIERVLPVLTRIFGRLAIRASHVANEESLALFASADALIEQESPNQADRDPKIGRARREATALALQSDAPFVMYCDGDRILHWAEQYPDELARVAAGLSERDFTVLGRTRRAFDSHPRTQRDTEAIVNHIFRTISGKAWDVMAMARGFSRRAAKAIVNGCLDEEISNDVSWPLYILLVGTFSCRYVAVEGLEFETADRYRDQIVAVGHYDEWLEQFETDLHRWIHRLDIARTHVEAMLPYAGKIV
jgi:hypothetical protein